MQVTHTSDPTSLLASFASTVRTPKLVRVSKWAEQKRILTKKTSARPGRWSNRVTPHLVEVMDRLGADDPCKRVVVMKGVQVGFTEVGNNWVGHSIDCDPAPMIVVQPTDTLGKEWTQLRFNELLDTTPELEERLVDEGRSKRGADNLSLKTFNNGAVLVVIGANAPSKMRSKPAGRVFFDEYEAAPAAVATTGGKVEGDPRIVIEKRAEAFPNPKFYYPSTPLIKGESAIEELFESGDQRRWFMPCPHCGHMQHMRWQQVKWPPHRPRDAAYECESCQELIGDEWRAWMIERGEWQPTREDLDAWDGETHSYHFPTLASPFTKWARLAKQFLEAKQALDNGDPSLMQVFVNTILGETWEEKGERPSDSVLMDRREAYGPESTGPEVPKGIVLLTASVDVQDDRLEAKVVGWGLGEEAWVIDHRTFWGEPDVPSGISPEGVWAELDIYLQRDWEHEAGVNIHVQGTCVDSGYLTTRVYDFCKARAHRNVWAIKGDKTDSKPVWPKKPSRNKKGKGNVHYMVCVNEAKWIVYRRLRRQTPGPGYIHFPEALDEGYFAQLTSERRRTKYIKGRAVHYWWKPDHVRNEALDLMVYNVAALHALYSLGRTLKQMSRRLEAWVEKMSTGQSTQPRRRRPGDPPPHIAKPKRTKRKRSGYLSRGRDKWGRR